MKRDNIFWGTALILVGLLLYLQTQGIITNVFRYFWPLALILLGAWIILGVYWRPTPSAEELFSIPLGGAKSARFKFSHGAGQIVISGGAPIGQALAGSAATGMNKASRLDGDRLEVKVEAGPSFVPFVGPSEGIWRFQLTQEIPLTLSVEAGASSLDLDQGLLFCTSSETGPAARMTTARRVPFDVDAASVNVRVPEATAGRIRVKEGVTSVNVDTNRFPQLDSGIYQSPGFETAANRAEITVEAGLGSISVK
jgi:hypothetical protein